MVNRIRECVLSPAFYKGGEAYGRKKLIDEEDWTEHYVRKGDPSKPTYYIIRRKNSTVGIFSNFNVFAGHIRYALSNGWLPVIDMQNYTNAILEPEKLGKENAWEYFFEQPLRISLEEAYNGENIILSKNVKRLPPYKEDSFYDDKNIELAKWRMLIKMGLLKIKPTIREEILAVRAKLIAPTDRVLGVYLRGTDYVAKKPTGHPIPPPIEYVRDVICEKVRAWRCNKIFLSTEDKGIIKFFKNTFGDGFGTFCVTIDREYKDYKPGERINNVSINRENDRYITTKEYLTEMIILSTCNSFITARCSGAAGVMMLSEGFENSMAFNLSLYGTRLVDWRKLIEQ